MQMITANSGSQTMHLPDIPSVYRIYKNLETDPREKVASRKKVHDDILSLLENRKTTAPSMVRIADYLLGSQWRVFEPDTIRLDLASFSTEIPPVNIDKLLATQTLFKRDFFFWDANVFENTIMPFNDQPAKPEVLQYPPVSFIAWTVELMEVLFRDKMIHLDLDMELKDMFDYEPATYTAVVAHSRGWVTLPKQLSFAEAPFDRMVHERDPDYADELIEKTKSRLGEIGDRNPDEISLSDTAVDKQVGKRLACRRYIKDEQARLKKEMSTLREHLL